MNAGLPQHAAFKVDKIFDNNVGITSPQASFVYGPTTKNPMLRYRDALVLFVDYYRLYKHYWKDLGPARPVNTSMKTIVLNVPLGDALVKDGKQSFVKIAKGGLTELIQVDTRLLTTENLSKSSQIIKAESNWQTNGAGANEFATLMLEGNDQMSTSIPKGGWNDLRDIANLLFNEKELREGTLAKEWLKEYGNLRTYLVFQNAKVAGGLVSACVDSGGFKRGDALRGSNVPHMLSRRSRVLIYAAEGGAKVDAAKQPEASGQPKIIVATTQEMNELVASVKAEVANAAAVLKDGMLGATQKLIAEL